MANVVELKSNFGLPVFINADQISAVTHTLGVTNIYVSGNPTPFVVEMPQAEIATFLGKVGFGIIR